MQSRFSFMEPSGSQRRKQADRLFFALLPPVETTVRLAGLALQFLSASHPDDGAGSWRLTDAARLHISLHAVGDYPYLREKIVFAARQAARAVVSPGIDVTLDTLTSFEAAPVKRRQRPLVLLGRGAGQHELHRALGAAMRRNGLRAGDRFTPHLTLGYGPRLIPAQAVDPVRIPFCEFVLIHSEVGLSRHHVLDRWPLSG